jgi:hypothetical protein
MDGRTTDRNPVQQWTCNGSTSMVWGLADVGNPLGDQIINERALVLPRRQRRIAPGRRAAPDL